MNRLRLNATAFTRLQAQVRLTGTFHHRLTAGNPWRRVYATVAIEQCAQGLHVTVTHNGNRHSLGVTLDKKRNDNAARVARFIEAAVNGETSNVPDVDEYLLISDMEIVLRQALRMGRGTYQLPADELEPELLISQNPHGSYIAEIRLDDARSLVVLPADSQRAYARLTSHLQQFMQGYRDALAAAA